MAGRSKNLYAYAKTEEYQQSEMIFVTTGQMGKPQVSEKRFVVMGLSETLPEWFKVKHFVKRKTTGKVQELQLGSVVRKGDEVTAVITGNVSARVNLGRMSSERRQNIKNLKKKK